MEIKKLFKRRTNVVFTLYQLEKKPIKTSYGCNLNVIKETIAIYRSATFECIIKITERCLSVAVSFRQ